MKTLYKRSIIRILSTIPLTVLIILVIFLTNISIARANTLTTHTASVQLTQHTLLKGGGGHGGGHSGGGRSSGSHSTSSHSTSSTSTGSTRYSGRNYSGNRYYSSHSSSGSYSGFSSFECLIGLAILFAIVLYFVFVAKKRNPRY